jgi:hypothetical protein
VSTAPTLIEAVSLNGYESFAAARELVGFDLETRERLKRPLIDKGIFRDYALGVASYSHDALFRPVEEQALGEYLFGSWDGWTYLPVTGDDAVHCMPYCAPEASYKVFEDVTNPLLHTREASEAGTTGRSRQ